MLVVGFNSGESLISLLLYVLMSIASIEGAESSGSLSKFLDSIKTIPNFSKYEEYEDSEPELIVIDNLYITNRLYGTEIIVDPYGDTEKEPKRNYYEDYEDEDEEW